MRTGHETGHEGKPIYGWGWLTDAAEEAAVQAMAPARRVKNAGIKGQRRSALGRAGVPANNGGVAQLSDDEYRRVAEQQYGAEGEIEIDPHGRVSRSEDQAGEIGAYVQAWVFVYRPERT